MKLTTPLVLRDFHYGRYSPNNVGDFLCPENSVADCENVNFDTILGNVQVRRGLQVLDKGGATLAANTIYRLSTGTKGATVLCLATGNVFLVAVMQSNTHVVIYWRNSITAQWAASNYDSTNYYAFVRFIQLNGHMFAAHNLDSMKESIDGATWTANGNCIPDSIKPSLVYRYQGRLLAAGDPAYPSRIWISSVVDLNANPFITWNVDPINGDWIDVNPDDGGQITGFAEASTFLLIFKNTGMYRTDDITSNITPDNIFNVGAVSQEVITMCQGVVYFFSGHDIRVTDSGYPQIISRAGIQDKLNSSYGSYLSSMASDSVNVWALMTPGNSSSCPVLKYSTRDQSWTVHVYAMPIYHFAPGVSTTFLECDISVICADNFVTGFNVFWAGLEQGYTDGAFVYREEMVQGATFNYWALTQDVDFGSRSTKKRISDKMIVYALNGAASSMAILNDAGTYVYPLPAYLSNRVNILRDVNSESFFFSFLWFGTSAAAVASFEGLEIQEITDTGVNYG